MRSPARKPARDAMEPARTASTGQYDVCVVAVLMPNPYDVDAEPRQVRNQVVKIAGEAAAASAALAHFRSTGSLPHAEAVMFR